MIQFFFGWTRPGLVVSRSLWNAASELDLHTYLIRELGKAINAESVLTYTITISNLHRDKSITNTAVLLKLTDGSTKSIVAIYTLLMEYYLL